MNDWKRFALHLQFPMCLNAGQRLKNWEKKIVNEKCSLYHYICCTLIVCKLFQSKNFPRFSVVLSTWEIIMYIIFKESSSVDEILYSMPLESIADWTMHACSNLPKVLFLNGSFNLLLRRLTILRSTVPSSLTTSSSTSSIIWRFRSKTPRTFPGGSYLAQT